MQEMIAAWVGIVQLSDKQVSQMPKVHLYTLKYPAFYLNIKEPML
jgi:hypothetical protein